MSRQIVAHKTVAKLAPLLKERLDIVSLVIEPVRRHGV